MKLLIKQEHAIHFLKDNVTEEVLYGGAAGGGKSALGCLWLMEMCQKYPGTRWLMGRSKLKTLKETTLNTFFELALKIAEANRLLPPPVVAVQDIISESNSYVRVRDAANF